jgi:hypothetical protein
LVGAASALGVGVPVGDGLLAAGEGDEAAVAVAVGVVIAGVPVGVAVGVSTVGVQAPARRSADAVSETRRGVSRGVHRASVAVLR